MGHISQAWTNLALPCADCVTKCAMNPAAPAVSATTDFSLLLWHFQILTTGSIHHSRESSKGVLLIAC